MAHVNVSARLCVDCLHTALKIPLMAACTFVLTYLLIKVLSLLPKSKWIVG